MDRIFIKRIVLRNFESHEDSDFELSDGFNAVVGKSCAGKSSILRSIRAVSVPRAFCQSWVREGCKSCTIRIETSAGWLEAEKGEGVNNFTYFIEGESKKPVVMKAPGDTAYEMASKILGIDTMRIETAGTKKRTNKKIDINLMKQSEPTGLLSEGGKEKAYLFDSLCGIEDSEGIRDGLKTEYMVRKKKNDELVSTLTQIKTEGFPEKNLQDERETYNIAVDLFEDSTEKKKILESMVQYYSSYEGKKSTMADVERDVKGIDVPDPEIVALFKKNITQWTEQIGLCDSYYKRNYFLANELAGIDIDISSLVRCAFNIEAEKDMAKRIEYYERLKVLSSRVSEIENELEKNKIEVNPSESGLLLKKNHYCLRWNELAEKISRINSELDGLAVVSINKSIQKDIDAIDLARKLYKDRLAIVKEIDAVGVELGFQEQEMVLLRNKRCELLANVTVCPVTGKAIGEKCSVFEEKEKGNK